MKKRIFLLLTFLLLVLSSAVAQDYWKKIGVQTHLFGGGLFGIGLKAKTTSHIAGDIGILYAPEFFWEIATKEENTGPSIGYFGQIDYYFTKSKIQHYMLFRVGYDQIAYELLALGYGVEFFVADKVSILLEGGIGYRPAYENVESRIESRTKKEANVLPVAFLFKFGIVFY